MDINRDVFVKKIFEWDYIKEILTTIVILWTHYFFELGKYRFFKVNSDLIRLDLYQAFFSLLWFIFFLLIFSIPSSVIYYLYCRIENKFNFEYREKVSITALCVLEIVIVQFDNFISLSNEVNMLLKCPIIIAALSLMIFIIKNENKKEKKIVNQYNNYIIILMLSLLLLFNLSAPLGFVRAGFETVSIIEENSKYYALVSNYGSEKVFQAVEKIDCGIKGCKGRKYEITKDPKPIVMNGSINFFDVSKIRR